MRPRRRRSRKLSAASSSVKPPELPVHLDESIYSRLLAQALEAAGVPVRRPGVDVPFGTGDATWLRRAGDEGWIVLMRDQRVRYRRLELESLMRAGVGAFVFTGGQATARQVVDVVTAALSKIIDLSISEPKPFIYTLTPGGRLSRLALRGRSSVRASE